MVTSKPNITSGLELDAWMQGQGLSARALADKLGVSPALVSYQRSGKGNWTASGVNSWPVAIR